jgi:hypothetical protein
MYSLITLALLVPGTVMALYNDHESARRGHASLRMTTTTDELVTIFDILSVTGSCIVISMQAIFSQWTLFVLLEQLQQVGEFPTPLPLHDQTLMQNHVQNRRANPMIFSVRVKILIL